MSGRNCGSDSFARPETAGPRMKGLKMKTRFAALATYLGGMALVLVAAGMFATFRGQLWPFDLRATVLVTLGGMASTFTGWGIVWALPFLAGLIAGKGRALLWAAGVAGMLALHAATGPAHGFAPISDIGLGPGLALYAAPMALVILSAALCRALVFPRARPRA